MQFGEDRPVRVCQGGQHASIQPVASISEESPRLQASVLFVQSIALQLCVAAGNRFVS